MDSRSEFLAWFSALRWAKSNHDLTVAFHNPQTTDKKNVCLYFPIYDFAPRLFSELPTYFFAIR